MVLVTVTTKLMVFLEYGPRFHSLYLISDIGISVAFGNVCFSVITDVKAKLRKSHELDNNEYNQCVSTTMASPIKVYGDFSSICHCHHLPMTLLACNPWSECHDGGWWGQSTMTTCSLWAISLPHHLSGWLLGGWWEWGWNYKGQIRCWYWIDSFKPCQKHTTYTKSSLFLGKVWRNP